MNKNRFYYLDNLKIFLIFLVIMHHAGQGYGPTGGWWFYMTSGPEKLEWMGRFFSVNASFFMGLFFMISGFFFAPSYEKKGFKNYTIDKLIRYGIPLWFAYWILMPLVFYGTYEWLSDNPSLPFFTFYTNIYVGIGSQPAWYKPILQWPESVFGFGHLWFVENLLVYALLYGCLRLLLRHTRFAQQFNFNIYLFSLLFIGIVAAATMLVRDYYKVGDIKNVLGFLMIEVAHWPIYTGFLMAGIIAHQTGMFQKFPSFYGHSLLVAGLLMATTMYFPFLFPDIIHVWSGKYFEVFETILGFSLSFGWVVFFRDHLNYTHPLLRHLSDNAYGAYIFHYPIVIGLQYGLDKIPIPLVAKFLLVGMICFIVSFSFSKMIRTSKMIQRVI